MRWQLHSEGLLLLYPKIIPTTEGLGQPGKKQVLSYVASTGVPTTSVAPLTGAAASSSGYEPVGPLATTPQPKKRATSRGPPQN